MLAKVVSSAVLGIDAYTVEVEADITPQLPMFATVGLPDGAVKEAKERVMSAIKNSDFIFPNKRSQSIWLRLISARKAQRLICPWLLEFWLRLDR